jgi:prepilin-type processing-associated H-X9-DG protein
LVVIAIIGILAAMVFPVFARARESARKAVCLSNVKNIALAIQMYLADNNDTLPPEEFRREVIEYFQMVPGGHSSRSFDVGDMNDRCNHDNHANPYIRWTLILDDYVKNRDVWRCPSSKLQNGAGWIVPGPDWFQNYVDSGGNFGKNTSGVGDGPCYPAWPPGWGGGVTDSFMQGMAAEMGDANTDKVFMQSIGPNVVYGLKLVEVQDPVRYVACGDTGAQATIGGFGLTAYPDICALECGNSACGWVDWEYCTWGADCGIYNNAPNNGSFLRNPELRKPYSRHLGGVNLGFLDGHASWVLAEGVVNMWNEDEIFGVDRWGPDPTDPDLLRRDHRFPRRLTRLVRTLPVRKVLVTTDGAPTIVGAPPSFARDLRRLRSSYLRCSRRM